MEHRAHSVTAVFGSRSRNDDRCDPPVAKDEIKVCRKERAIPMLLDNVSLGAGARPEKISTPDVPSTKVEWSAIGGYKSS